MKTPLLTLLALGFLGATSWAAVDREEFVQEFRKACAGKGGVLDGVQPNDVAAPAVTKALRALYPDYDKAIQTLAGNREDGLKALGSFAQHENPFLAAEASYTLARNLTGLRRHEDALPLLEKISSDWAEKSLRSPDALFYLGVCQAETLKRSEAIGSLKQFVENNPNAPERLREQATERLNALRRDGEGSIGDVAFHMGFSERRLALGDSGEKTQMVQEHIVEMLDMLIKQATSPG